MKYFVNFPYTAESLKAEFRALCLTMHPDKGGNADEFKAMSAEYEQVFNDINGTKATATSYTATADDVADMMGAPLKGTKGKTFADLVARLVYVFTDEALTAEYNTDGDLSECYGWDGSALSPLSRACYCRKYGRTFVELAEVAAREQMKKDAESYEQSNHAAHVREARKNQADGEPAPKVGAFVFGVGCGWKSDGGRGVFVNFEAFAHDPDHYGEKYDDPAHLFKVCAVFNVSPEEFADPTTADRLVSEAREQGREFPGGAATDDPDREDPRDDYKYYYTKAAAVVCGSRWYLIDAQGYEYARYCYIPSTWRTMYAAEVAAAVAKEEARKAEEARKEAEERAARFAEYLKACEKYAEYMEDIRPLHEAEKEARSREHKAYTAAGYRRTDESRQAAKDAQRAAAQVMAAQKRNIIAMAAAIYPGIKAKALKGDSWKGGYKIVYYDGPTLETFQNNTDFDLFAEYWEQSNYDDTTTYHREEFTDFAQKYMADGHYTVSVEREWSDETKARLIAAVLEAVPAAAGCSWENRHAWTQDEIKKAAAACGVDGFELWRAYDHKHSFYNYITAENVARWCFDMMAFEIETPKAKKADKGAKATKPTDGKQDTQKPATANESEPESTPATISETKTTETPAAGLRLVELSDGVAVVGDNWKDTYFNKKHIKAHGCKWNNDAKQWEAHDAADVLRVRAWFAIRDGFGVDNEQDEATATAAADPEPTEPTTDATTDKADEVPTEPTTTGGADTLEHSAKISALVVAVADFFGTLARVSREAATWEGVTVPVATLARWKAETEEGTKRTAETFAEVCACLSSLTPDSRRDFDALGVIFWTLAEQLRNGYDAATIGTATDYARAQLFALIERTQSPQQAAKIREAFESFREAA